MARWNENGVGICPLLLKRRALVKQKVQRARKSYPENDERHKGIERDTCVNRGRRDLLWSTKEMQEGKNTEEMETNRWQRKKGKLRELIYGKVEF